MCITPIVFIVLYFYIPQGKSANEKKIVQSDFLEMRIAQTPYKATLYVWNGVSAFFFSSRVTPFHSHNTMQLVFDIRKSFKCRTPDTAWQDYKSVIIKENAIHQLDTNGSVQLLLYLDAESEMAKAIRARYLQHRDVASPDIDVNDFLKRGQLEQCLLEPNRELLEHIVHQLLRQVASCEKPVAVDERITAVLKVLSEEQLREITIDVLADHVCLSESRLRSLFKRVTGISLHRYIIWNRIMRAITRILEGSTVADAALDCGFTDTSHFHKLLVQMFGISPSQFIKENNQKSIVICHHDPLRIQTRMHNEKSWEIEKIYSN
jgi:AraC-like DNA-binding protein